MKKQLVLTIIFGWCLCCRAQEADTVKLVTTFGKPDGKEVSSKIDKEGGTLVSDDGKVELIIPPGALAKKTTISIQAVTNTMQPGRGKAYHLLPSGITFRQPVQLIFHYTAEEQNGYDPELNGIAMQDKHGQWYDQADAVVDTVARTMTAKINHFSYWVRYEKARIFPLGDRVKVNKKISVYLEYIYADRDEAAEAGLSVIKVPVLPEWSVNGHKNGNNEVGDIVPLNGTIRIVHYYAPSSVPDQNPVQITAEFKNVNFRIGKKNFRNLKISCRVLVYDNAYEVKMEMWGKNTGICNLGEWFDTGSFIVQFEGAKTKVLDIQNNMLKITGQEKCPCSPEWVNKSNTLGLIHISGVQKITVQPPSPPGFPHSYIQIFFKPARAVFPIYRFSCPTGVVPLHPPPMGAIPSMVDFFANDEEQVLYEDRMENFKITVRPIKDD